MQTVTYSSRAFRENMASAFEAVLAGDQVVILRGTDIFVLSKGKVELIEQAAQGENNG